MSLDLKSNNHQNNLNSGNLTEYRIYGFEDYRFDVEHLMLYRRGKEVPLTPKQAETLMALIEQPGEIISKEALMRRLWGDTAVEESNLVQNIYVLRKILGDTAEGEPMIETLRRRGYRFNAKVVEHMHRLPEVSAAIRVAELEGALQAKLIKGPTPTSDQVPRSAEDEVRDMGLNGTSRTTPGNDANPAQIEKSDNADLRPDEIHSYRFRSFTLKPRERQLFNRDQLVSLTPKAFDVLTLLIANAGHLVTKEELLETIWTESFVEEANLARLVHMIRKALGEDENGNKFIETVPTRGYRFVAELEKVIVKQREHPDTSPIDGAGQFSPNGSEPAPPVNTESIPMPIAYKKAASRLLFAGLSIVVVIGVIAAIAVWRKNTVGTVPAKEHPISIAVLPFRPIGTGEYDHSYNIAFANSVIADLDQSKRLSIRPFTPGDYTGLTQDPVAAGKERATDYVLDSNYVVNNGRLQVTANVINVSTQSVEWSFKYEGSDNDLYAAGPKVAARIVPQLLAKLNLPTVVPGNHGTENEEAWRSYVQGMILSNKRTVEDAEKAVDEFNKAIRLDPNYAMAYMGLAHAIQTKITNGDDPKKLCGPARQAETKALEIDPTSGDAMVMLATNRMLCTWEIDQAEQEYRRAVQLSPNSAHVRRFYAVNIVNEKRFDEALEHLKVAQELEPNNPFNEKLIGRALFFARRWDEAIEASIKARQLVPEAEQTSFVYMSYEMKGDLDNAFKWFLDVKSLDGEPEEALNDWRKTFAESGWQGVLRRRLERSLEDEKRVEDVNKHARLLEEITTLSVQLGQYDQAFEYMSRAADSYVLFAGQMPVNPYLDPVRSDPRYKAIMARTWNSRGGNWQ